MKKILTTIIAVCATILLQSCDSPLRGYYSSLRVSPDDDYSSIVNNPAYSTPAKVVGIQILKQEVSCGYATLEMLGKWKGKDITENKLYKANNNSVTTSIGAGFLKEISKQFPEWNVIRCVNCSNSQLLETIYLTLKSGFPVPFEWAAKDTNGNWTLHFSLITEIDFPNNKIVVANPYGYFQTLTIDDFIKATRYESYENMEWFFEAGYNTNLFNQNTIYVISEN